MRKAGTLVRYCNLCRAAVTIGSNESGFTAHHAAPVCKGWLALETNADGFMTMGIIYGATREEEYEPASSVGR